MLLPRPCIRPRSFVPPGRRYVRICRSACAWHPRAPVPLADAQRLSGSRVGGRRLRVGHEDSRHAHWPGPSLSRPPSVSTYQPPRPTDDSTSPSPVCYVLRQRLCVPSVLRVWSVSRRPAPRLLLGIARCPSPP